MQQHESGIAQYGLRVAVDYRHIQADLGGSVAWHGQGAVLAGSVLEVSQQTVGTLSVTGQQSVRIAFAPHAVGDITLVFHGSGPHLHDVIIDLAEGADCTFRTQCSIEGNARLHSEVTLGERASYHEVITGEVAAQAVFDGFTHVRHVAPEGRSRLVAKLVLAEAAKAVVRSKVTIAREAVRSRSSQRIDALLLSGRAEADLLPTMEVATDDVVCHHAATTVHPDAETLFYLASRGLTDVAAKQLIAEAFLAI